MKTNLTKEQQAIVDARAGLVTVDAGAGVGKTTTLMERVRSLIEEGTPANQIVALSFTVKSAGDIQAKVLDNLGDEAKGLHSRTIHSFALYVLRVAEKLGRIGKVKIVSEEVGIEQSRDIILNVLSENNVKELTEEELAAAYKAQADTPAKLTKLLKSEGFVVSKKRGEKAEISKTESDTISKILRVVDLYHNRGVEANDDYEVDLRLSLGLTGKTVVQIGGGFYFAKDIPFMESIRALGEVADGINDGNGYLHVRVSSLCIIASKIYDKDIANEMFSVDQLPYLMIDEVQDIDDGQIAFINSINAGSLFIVGDTNQSLYAFRYVVPDVINRSEELFPNYAKKGAIHLELTTNFRCPAGVIEYANELISCNGETKELVPSKDGHGLSIIAGSDYDDFLESVVSSIKDLVSQGVSYNKIAIISRYFSDLTEMEPFLLARNIPVEIRQERSFSNHVIVKLITSIINTQTNADNPQSFYDLLSCLNDYLKPKIKFGANSKREFDETVDRGLSVTDALKRLLDTKVLADETGHIREISEMLIRYRDMVDDDIPTNMLYGYIITSPLVKSWLNVRSEHNAKEDEETLAHLGAISSSVSDVEDFVDIMSINTQVLSSIDEKIIMTSAHASKGLEWDYVFCVGFEANHFPSFHMVNTATPISPPKSPYEIQSSGDLNEERRMAYVMLTRPKKKLFMAWSAQKYADSKSGKAGKRKSVESMPSMFFMEAGINSGFESMTFKGKRKLIREKSGKLTSFQK